MVRLKRTTIPAVLAGAMIAWAPQAEATAIASVDFSFAGLRPWWALVDGDFHEGDVDDFLTLSQHSLSVTEGTHEAGAGMAGSSYDGGVSGNGAFFSVASNAKVDGMGTARSRIDLAVVIAVTNTASVTIDGYTLWRSYSAFNPGGSPIGAAVDDTAFEFASFETTVWGFSLDPLERVDGHACRTDGLGDATFVVDNPPAYACGVSSPDDNIQDIGGGPLAPGESHLYYARLLVETTAAAQVSEPDTLLLMLGAIGGLGLAARRRARGRTIAAREPASRRTAGLSATTRR